MNGYEKIATANISLPAEFTPIQNVCKIKTECGCIFIMKDTKNINYCPKCGAKLKHAEQKSGK
jgi:rRNA maturation endonuclease Nob1